MHCVMKMKCINWLKDFLLMMITRLEYDYEKAKKYRKIKIQELVNNLPLKFEDLHEGMWIWDDKTKSYIYIFKP